MMEESSVADEPVITKTIARGESRHSTRRVGDFGRQRSHPGGGAVNLICMTSQKVTRKDFGSEVRASLDVSLFIKEAQLLLDVGEMSVEGVVDQMLRAMLEGEPMTSLAEAKSVVFVHDSGE
ncbi:uncharacterized protein LOC122374922 [Amphibalanus amphitrite]|uniref:uncharacterized protein LOC122374922 n=1 Tax=Amphibalanus amphitrite TaxID=1232801 RepID=UPI001C92B198|nr:uncharacterized protein LOC122374922 [Amphibalanus amphitrite]